MNEYIIIILMFSIGIFLYVTIKDELDEIRKILEKKDE